MLLERGNGVGDKRADILRRSAKQAHSSPRLIQCHRCVPFLVSQTTEGNKIPSLGRQQFIWGEMGAVGGGEQEKRRQSGLPQGTKGNKADKGQASLSFPVVPSFRRKKVPSRGPVSSQSLTT